ncbi:unnamed protein product, partial [Staurois parvus]
QALGPRRGGGRRTPRRSDRSRALRRSGGRWTPRRMRQVSGPQAERRAPDPQAAATGLGPSVGAAGAGTPRRERWAPDPQMERQVSGPQAERRGRRTPRWSDRSRALRRSGGGPSHQATTVGSESTGMTAGTGSDIGSLSGWNSGHRVTRHQVIWLD